VRAYYSGLQAEAGGEGVGVRVPTPSHVAITATAPASEAALKRNGSCDPTHVLGIFSVRSPQLGPACYYVRPFFDRSA